jgi:hypothetical protein
MFKHKFWLATLPVNALLFSKTDPEKLRYQEGTDPYHDLAALQGLYMYLTHVESHLVALSPASQALRISNSWIQYHSVPHRLKDRRLG